MQHMANGNNKNNTNNNNGGKQSDNANDAVNLEIQQDERYKNLDPRMVELIENEIMER